MGHVATPITQHQQCKLKSFVVVVFVVVVVAFIVVVAVVVVAPCR